MARGRHRRRSWLRRLRRRPVPVAVVSGVVVALTRDISVLEDEVARLRGVEAQSTAAAVSVQLRLERVEAELVTARVDVAEARSEVAGLRDEIAVLRAQVDGLREELAWSFASVEIPVAAPKVIDLTTPRASTA